MSKKEEMIEMKGFRVFFLISLIVLIFIGGFNGITYAENDEYQAEPSIEVQVEKSGHDGADGLIDINSTNYLKSWSSGILKSSSTTVKVSGTTTAYSSADKISISLYLQVRDESNGTWEDYAYLGGDSASNQDEISDSIYAKVPAGYYYRTKAKHSVTSNSITESATSYSKAIIID